MFSPERVSSDCSRCRMRSVMTRVFPVPAPAITSSGPSPCVIARRCASLTFSPLSPSGSISNKVAIDIEGYRIFRARGNGGYFCSLLMLPLRKFAGCHFRVKFRRFPFRNRQCLPFVPSEVPRKINYLPDMIGIVSDLAVDGLHYGMRLGADGNRAG